MNLNDHIRAIFPAEQLHCAQCQRASCAALPCPTRRSARLHGYKEPKWASRGELAAGSGTAAYEDRGTSDIDPWTRTTDLHQGRGR